VAEVVVERAGLTLSGDDDGAGTPVVLLHGLTASRRYVVMGSSSLERSGHRVIAYDARGHGRSSPASDPAAYGYEDLVGDLGAVLDACGLERAVLAGASMGAHTLLAFALAHPERVGGLVVITPAYDPATYDQPARLEHWDELADGLSRGGIEGFVAAYEEQRIPAAWHDTVVTVIRQRLAVHGHLDALADAIRVVPRSQPFLGWGELGAIEVPVAVVVSADEPDPGHPQAVGEAYAAAIPGARLVLDEPGRSPVAWQGSQLSKLIAEVAAKGG
jgi:pimeloyl-ACP methyl ester carboxylesterase